MISTLSRVNKVLLYSVAFMLPLLTETWMSGLLLLVVATYLPIRFKEHKDTPAVAVNAVRLAMIFIVLVAAVGFSTSPTDSLTAFLRYGNAFLLMLIIQWTFHKKNEIMFFIQLFVTSSTLVALYGILQSFIRKSTTDAWVDKVLHPDIDMRVSSIMQNPNNLAEFLVLAIPLTFALILYKKNWMHKLIGVGMLGIMTYCMVLSYSRSGYLGMAFAFALFVVLAEKRLLLVLPVLLPPLIIWMPKGLASRLDSLMESVKAYMANPDSVKDTSVAYRIRIWNGAGKILNEFFDYGVGLGNETFTRVYPFFREYGVIAKHAHNLFLELLIEFGIFGFIVLMLFIFGLLLQSVRLILATKNKFNKYISAACVAAVLGLMITGMTEYTWFYHKVFYSFFMLLGVLMSLYNNEQYNQVLAEQPLKVSPIGKKLKGTKQKQLLET